MYNRFTHHPENYRNKSLSYREKQQSGNYEELFRYQAGDALCSLYAHLTTLSQLFNLTELIIKLVDYASMHQ